MKVILSPYLDQTPSNSLLQKGDGRWNQTIIGPTGFLSLLERIMGLSGVFPENYTRVEEYRKVLGKAPTAFYSKSFEVDPLETTKRVLKMRDTLYLYGHDFKNQKEMPRRLKDICKAEKEATLPPGIAERWRAVLGAELPGGTISEIELLAPIEEFPFAVKEFLKSCDVKIVEVNNKVCSTGDLKSFIEIIEGSKNKKVKGDGTLVLLEGNRYEINSYLAKTISEDSVTVLSQDPNGPARALSNEGRPSIGESYSSSNTLGLQLLKLIPYFLVSPVDPAMVVAFMNITPSPLGAKLSRKIAEQLSGTPGVEGDEFQSFLKELEPEDREKCSTLFDRERVNRGNGILIRELIELFRYLASWTQLNEDLKSLYLSATRLVERLSTIDEDSISLTETMRIIGDSLVETQHTQSTAEVGAPALISHIGGIVAPTSELIWHPFCSSPKSFCEQDLFYGEEINYLLDLGIKLDGAIDEIGSISRALKYVEGKLILCLGDDRHPLYADIMNSFDHPEKLIVDVREEKRAYEKVTVKSIPEELSEFKVSIGKIDPTPEHLSYSALDKIIYHPMDWFLERVAKFNEQGAVGIDEANKLHGLLSHYIFEYLLERRIFDPKKAKAWFKSDYDALVAKEFTPFMKEGLDSLRAKVKGHISEAYLNFIKEIVNDGWEVSGLEEKHKGQFLGIELRGFVDCLLKRGKEWAIVDYKWGKAKYKVTEIEEDRALQLDVYKRLLKTNCHTAFYSIQDKCFIARDKKAFSNALTGDEIQDNEVFWSMVESTYKARMKMFKKGVVPFSSEEGEIDIAEEHPFSPYDTLMGRGK